jgi:hypothetical protein
MSFSQNMMPAYVFGIIKYFGLKIKGLRKQISFFGVMSEQGSRGEGLGIKNQPGFDGHNYSI